MSARYLSVYFHNVAGESERVFMRRSKPSIRSPRRQRQGGSGRTRRGRAARLWGGQRQTFGHRQPGVIL